MAAIPGQCTRATAHPDDQPGGAAELGLGQGRAARIPFRGIINSTLSGDSVVKFLGCTRNQYHQNRNLTMNNKTSHVYLLLILSAMAAVAGPLLWNVRARGADAVAEESPHSLLLIALQPPRVLPSGPNDQDNYERYVETQLVLVKSRVVVEAVLRQAAISQLPAIKNQADPAAWLRRNLEATSLKNTEVIQVSMAARSGADANDQAAIINAVVQSYMDEIVNADLKRRLDRQSMLKKLNQKYQDMMRERRETARKLSESAASGDQFAGPDQKSLSRRYDGLMDRRLTLRLDRAQTETLLGRKSKGAGSQTEEVRKEIALLEEHLAVLTAQETVLHEELDHLTRESRNAANGRLDLAETMTDLAAMEDTYRKVRAEVEALTVELEGPRRIRVLEGAVAQPGNK
jgi:hypothetical protein